MNTSSVASVLVVTGALLTACGGRSSDDKDGSPPQAIELSSAALGSSVDASPRQEVDITLQTIGAGEYASPSVSSDKIQFLDVTTPAAQNPGGPIQQFHFEAESPGTAVITIPHTVRSQAFDVTIVVQ